MKKLLVIFLLILVSNISSAQTGWGYVNYTSYKTHNGNGAINQYSQFANSSSDFDAMLSTANSNTTITNTGETQIVNLYNGSLAVPHWNSDYFAFKFDFWFIPKVTGTYYFGTNSDDASDISIDGTIIATYYGGHGASGYRTGQFNMIAGKRYKVVYRGQEFGGGEAFYFQWYRPGVGWGYWDDEVTNINNTPTKKANANFNFNTNLDGTKFSIGSDVLSSVGKVDITNSLDSNKVSNGYKLIVSPDQWESIIINPYDVGLGGHRLQLDERIFSGTGINLNDITSIKLFDIYEGPINVLDFNGWWKQWTIPTNIWDKITASSYQSSLRLQDGWYALKAGSNVSFSNQMNYKPQSIQLTTTNNLATLYNSIVTVSDVWLAFKEVSNVGIFGNQSGNEFTRGIQYQNGDVNDDGYFNEQDCFLLLQNLTGKKSLVDTFNLNKTLRIIPQSTYDNIGKSNWNTFTNPLGSSYLFDINTGKPTDTFNLAIAWKGDVNLSHSTTPASNGITSMSVRTMSTTISTDVNASIITEFTVGKFYTYITFDPLQQQVVGNQFQLNYDNSVLKFEGVEFKTKGSPMNYGTDKGTYINLGSLITDGSTILDKTTEYKITFTPIKPITNGLGLVGISTTDAINTDGKQLNVKIN